MDEFKNFVNDLPYYFTKKSKANFMNKVSYFVEASKVESELNELILLIKNAKLYTYALGAIADNKFINNMRDLPKDNITSLNMQFTWVMDKRYIFDLTLHFTSIGCTSELFIEDNRTHKCLFTEEGEFLEVYNKLLTWVDDF